MSAPVELAKQCLDVGLYTADTEATLAFYRDTLGLPYEELLKVSKGNRQHRLGLRGSVLKVNESRDPLTAAPSGFRRLIIADPLLKQPDSHTDPQGVPVDRVLPGTEGVTAVGIVMAVADVGDQVRFLTDGLWGDALGPELTSTPQPQRQRVRIGTTVLFIEEDPLAPTSVPQRAAGFQYVTIQVRDVAITHRHLLSLGFEEAMTPVRLGDTAAISFVRDPGGNWWEISQRANLTGELPDLPRMALPTAD